MNTQNISSVAEQSNKLFPYSVKVTKFGDYTEEDLEDYFCDDKDSVKAIIPNNQREYAFVRFKNKVDQEKALTYNGKFLGTEPISVVENHFEYHNNNSSVPQPGSYLTEEFKEYKVLQKSAENLSQKEFPVLVYNLPPVSENHLQQKFQGVGRILRCVLCVDIRQQFSGDAYIWFGSREEAEKACQFYNDTSITGQNGKTATIQNYFSLAGPIESVEVVNYHDYSYGQRAYGFLTFINPNDVIKALYFHKKQLVENILTVNRADITEYGTFLGGIPLGTFTLNDIRSTLDHLFPGKIGSIFYDENKANPPLFVNFKDEESRQKYVNMRGLFSTHEPQIKEKSRSIGPIPQREGSFIVFIYKIPTETTKKEFEELFSLCGPIESLFLENSENTFTRGRITFTTKNGAETALKFDQSTVKNWPLPIEIRENNEGYDAKREYPFTAKIYNYSPALKLMDIEKNICVTPGNVVVKRSQPSGPVGSQFLYANFRKKEDLEALLHVSGQFSLRGAIPARIESQALNSFQYDQPTRETNKDWTITVEYNQNLNPSILWDVFGRIGSIIRIETTKPYKITLTPNH